MLTALRRMHSTVLRTPLGTRSVLRLEGSGTARFLQGLTTNDVELLQLHPLQYTMFLNAKGRVLCDAFLYRVDEEHYLLDCDLRVNSLLMSHLSKYNLRGKTTVTDASAALRVACVVNGEGTPFKGVVCGGQDPRFIRQSYSTSPQYLTIAQDIQRMDRFVVDKIAGDAVEHRETAYHSLRVRLGVSEGSEDHQPEVALPLQCNLDYLNGVSFTKGCYLGQELTARTHHTGVVRKRIVPLQLAHPSVLDLAGADVVDIDSGQNAGTVLTYDADAGVALAMLRLQFASNRLQLHKASEDVGPLACHAGIPRWWPPSDHNQVGMVRGPAFTDNFEASHNVASPAGAAAPAGPSSSS